MTNNPDIAKIAAGMFERWPGYNEQSWAERFAELDRRHTRLQEKFHRLATSEIVVRAHLKEPTP